jgi:hypothetical protein
MARDDRAAPEYEGRGNACEDAERSPAWNTGSGQSISCWNPGLLRLRRRAPRMTIGKSIGW